MRARFVAGFIGSPAMNFIPGHINEDDAFVSDEGIVFDLPVSSHDLRGRRLEFGIRPEHLQLVPQGTPNAIGAQVHVVEPTGSETMVLARSGRHEIIAVFRDRHMFTPDEIIALKPDLARSHLFDADASDRRTIPLG